MTLKSLSSYVAIVAMLLMLSSCKKAPYYFSFGNTTGNTTANGVPPNFESTVTASLNEGPVLLSETSTEKPLEAPATKKSKRALKNSSASTPNSVTTNSSEELNAPAQDVATQKKPTSSEKKAQKAGGKSQTAAFLIALLPALIGICGIQRFYLGGSKNIVIGIVQLLTMGCCGIWQLVDIIRIGVGELMPPDGDYTEKW